MVHPISIFVFPPLAFYRVLNADIFFFLQYLDKRLFVQLNGSRKVIGVLRGYDVCVDVKLGTEHELC